MLYILIGILLFVILVMRIMIIDLWTTKEVLKTKVEIAEICVDYISKKDTIPKEDREKILNKINEYKPNIIKYSFVNYIIKEDI